MAINKVMYGANTLIDLTSDTVSADTLGKGSTAHDKSGSDITGTLESGSSTGGGSETWVLNSTIDVRTKFSYPITFTSNGKNYEIFAVGGIGSIGDEIYYSLIYGSDRVLTGDLGGLFDSEHAIYRKITFATTPTGDLLTWLEANAVKQASDTAVQESKSVSITENGTTTINSDVPYDAIKSVEVTANVASSGGGISDNIWVLGDESED